MKSSFEPTTRTLQKIMKTILEHGHENKTSLALYSNLNYVRLAKHIVWLENKGLVKSTIEDDKINMLMTDKGRVFSATMLD